MKKMNSHGSIIMVLIEAIFLLLTVEPIFANSNYSLKLCSQPDANYTCYEAKEGDTWSKVFPDPKIQDMLEKINRTNIELQPGMIYAVPNNLAQLHDMTLNQISPLEKNVVPVKRKVVVVDLGNQAFAAYDEDGNLVRWGPASGGKTWCPDVKRDCSTPAGIYYAIAKEGEDCVSSKYPVPDGGAPMPYCIYFHGGYAIHGSALAGYPDSHGCVHLFYDDAKWLNQEFVNTGVNGTMIVIRP